MITQHRLTVYVTGGDSTVNFSGCSYYFMASLGEELRDSDVRSVPMSTYRQLAGAALRWGLRFRTDPRPVFFVTPEYQNANWERFSGQVEENSILISFPQILPNRTNSRLRKKYLIVDMTHEQYLDYPQFKGMPDRVRRSILKQERESYGAADRIFAITDTVQRQLVQDYGVAAAKVEVIGRGLNLPHPVSDLRHPARARNDGGQVIRIGFVGLDYRRKGLPDLINALDADEGLRSQFVVEAIGPRPGDLPARPYLHLHGYINKDTHLRRYSAILAGCDIGYLFSRSEGIPGSVLEFLSFGVPCLISDIEGMQSIRALPGVLCVPLSEGFVGVRNALQALSASSHMLTDLKAAAAGTSFDGWRQQARAVARWCQP